MIDQDKYDSIHESLNENLKTCFEEYEELNRTAVLKDGIARSIERWYKERYSIIGNVLETVRNAVYYEMAMRWYSLD